MNNKLKPPSIITEFVEDKYLTKDRSELTAKSYTNTLIEFFKFLKCKDNNINLETLGTIKDIDNYLRTVDVSDIDINYIRNITSKDINRFIAYLKLTRDNENSSRANKESALREFFKYLETERLISENPMLHIEKTKIKKRLPVYMTLDESMKLILDGLDKRNCNYLRDKCILSIFLGCGLRLAELISLNIESVEENQLRFVGKGDKERKVPLNKACIKAIKEYLEVRPNVDTNALFLSTRKSRIHRSTVEGMVEKVKTRAGIDKNITPHKLRHTASTLMFKHGHVNVVTLKEILGHNSLQTTMIYTHVDDEDMKNAIDSNPMADVF